MSDDFFSGFMPLINSISISTETNSISSNGDLVQIHAIKITTVDNAEYVFSITPADLSRLHFLILKGLIS
jgi:hypothetical protein